MHDKYNNFETNREYQSKADRGKTDQLGSPKNQFSSTQKITLRMPNKTIENPKSR